MKMYNPPPGIIRVDINATDLDGRKFKLSKMITFEEAREFFPEWMKHVGEEWKRDFHG